MDDLSLPAFVSYRWLAVVFIAALVTFHVVLVWVRPLGKLGWKRIDYIWLALGSFGVLGGVNSARQILAQELLPFFESRLQAEASGVAERIEFGTSGAVCRKFVPSNYSPPPDEFERIQREFDALCSWFIEAAKRTPSELSKRTPLTLERLGGSPPPSGADQWAIQRLADAVDNYNQVLSYKDRLTNAGRQSDVERSLTIIWPFLFVIALALRITKVTGEIRLDRG